VLAACRRIHELISFSSSEAGEKTMLHHLLAHFKRSEKGPMQLIWATAIIGRGCGLKVGACLHPCICI
jgi:hypothetical protein